LIGKHLAEKKIAEVVGADSFRYLSLDGFAETVGIGKGDLCMGCFNCRYPEV